MQALWTMLIIKWPFCVRGFYLQQFVVFPLHSEHPSNPAKSQTLVKISISDLRPCMLCCHSLSLLVSAFQCNVDHSFPFLGKWYNTVKLKLTFCLPEQSPILLLSLGCTPTGPKYKIHTHEVQIPQSNWSKYNIYM